MICFDRVADRISVGTCPTGKTDIWRLKQAGFTAVLNLQTENDFATHNIDQAVLEQSCLYDDIVSCRVPIIDFDDDDLIVQLPLAAQTLHTMVEAGHQVYVHCTVGRQRSPSVVICYLVWHRQLGLKDSIQRVLAARNCAPPVPVLEIADALYQKNAISQ